MEIYIIHYIKNCGPPPPIYVNPNPGIGKKPDNRQDSLKVDFNNHQGYINIETLFLYIIISSTGIAEELLKFLVLLSKILQGHNIITGLQFNSKMKNLLEGKTLRFFKQKYQSIGNKTIIKLNFLLNLLQLDYSLQRHSNTIIGTSSGACLSPGNPIDMQVHLPCEQDF